MIAQAELLRLLKKVPCKLFAIRYSLLFSLGYAQDEAFSRFCF